MKFIKSSKVLLLAIIIALSSAIINTTRAAALTQDPANVTTQAGQSTNTPTSTEIAQMGTKAASQTTGSSFFAPIENVVQSVNNFIDDVTGFVQNDVFGSLNNLLSSTLGAVKVPVLNQVSDNIMKSSTANNEGTKLSETLENKIGGEGSYAIKDDFNKQAERATAIGVANGATLSTQAQERSAQQLLAAQTATHNSNQLSEDSKNQDVTQRIMQNISQQTALNAQTNEMLIQEAQQARTDRAVNNVLTAQAAKEIAAINTSSRRADAASGNAASQQAGMLMLPGGGTIGADDADQ
ncbi:hypothetical protein H6G81_04520 [Scytonema hofmannii FACHB-248]|uniref:Uncharacterized protein n=1 Tax=Scytonema hofmannii FACHB-248 TaxID=1842502 RepID=A0ABR8GK98_9CYAN|nr:MULTISPECIES: hypothetical protein [Nostocales]MBD2603814.1 hypothetical protein [Scytonema hofmannii FACHB-248]